MRSYKNNKGNLSSPREVFDVIRIQMQGILDDPAKLIEFLVTYLKPKEVEKKKNGEVFTPPSLINEKFNKLEEVCPDIWSNPSRKFLDPANGIGNYPALAYQRLMNGLEKVFPNIEERKKHILENMLYMCELTGMNVEVSRKLFDPESKYKLNIHHGSFLDLDITKEWGIEKFDIIMGNPPYNKDVSHNNAKGQIIWPAFVTKSYELLKNDSYLLFVHPPNWRKPNHNLRNIYFKNQLHYLKIFSDRQVDKLFTCKIRVDYYILQKCKIYKNTTVVDEIGENTLMMLNDTVEYIPNYGISIHNKVKSLDISKLTCVNPRSHDTTRKFVTKTESSEFSYKLFNTSSSKGIPYYFSSTEHPAQYFKKVMFSNGRYIYPIYDDGVLGGTQSCLYICVSDKEAGEKLIDYLNSKLFKFLIKSSKFANFGTSHEFISSLPNLSSGVNNLKFSDDELVLINDV